MDKVSIIIPVYNSEKFLSQCIKSVLSQTYKNLEIITINDGSTDNSLQILKQYSDKITIINQKNKGLAETLNVGIKNMSGLWFKWFSPDDILKLHAIEILVAEIQKLPINTIVYSNWEIIDKNNNVIRSFSESNYNELTNFDFNIRLLDAQQINVNTTLIPKYLFEQDCKFRNLEDPVAIDYDFFLRAGIICNTKFHLIEKKLMQYRIHSEQLSHHQITQTLDFLPKIRDNILSQLSNETKKKYSKFLIQYKKNKPISKKLMQYGLNLSKTKLSANLTDKLLIFYLNKIRSSR